MVCTSPLLKPGGGMFSILAASAYYDHGNSIGRWVELPDAIFAKSGISGLGSYTVFTKLTMGAQHANC